jgi:O-antigen/teichoic acid export membrane protein
VASIRSLAGGLRRNPLSSGTLAVGIGLAVAGLSAYGFLVVVARALSGERYAALASFWALLFVCGNGFYMPFEQTISRAIAARRVRGEGGRPVVARAALIGGALTATLILIIVIAAGPLNRQVFRGDGLLLVALGLGLAGYLLQFTARGALAGNGRFKPYGIALGLEGSFRVVFCILLRVAGVHTAGPYGLALAVATYLSLAIAIAGQRGLLRPGSRAAWKEVSNALGFLLVGSVFVQFLLSIGTVVVQIFATDAQKAAAGQFLNARVIAYIPIFLFQALQAAMLPRLSALAAANRFTDFRVLIRQLMLVIGLVGLVTVVGFGALGPPVTSQLFGKPTPLSHLDFALLSASCTGFMLGQIFGQSLIALTGYRRVAAGWTAGGVTFVLVSLLGWDTSLPHLFLRVEVGLLAGAAMAVAVMSTLLAPLLRFRHTADTEKRIATAET